MLRGNQVGLDRQRPGDLELTVAELPTNSVIHGASGGTLRTWMEGEQVVCEVHETRTG